MDTQPAYPDLKVAFFLVANMVFHREWEGGVEVYQAAKESSYSFQIGTAHKWQHFYQLHVQSHFDGDFICALTALNYSCNKTVTKVRIKRRKALIQK